MTWIHHDQPEEKASREQSEQCVQADEPAPKKPKTVPSQGKVMARVFWDDSGIIFIDYFKWPN